MSPLSDRLRPNVEAAPWVITAVKALEEELAALRAEVRKQVAGSKTVFDREVVDRAKKYDRWICLLCKSGTPGVHFTLDDRVTPCPNGERR